MPFPSRITLAQAPTPLQRLDRLSAHTGVEFFMKRDDMTGDIGLAGNKVRKLEYLVAQALAEGATHLLTTGGPQSNHARATATVAAKLNLSAILILAGTDPGRREGNLLLDQLVGADIRFPGAFTSEEQAHCLEEAATELRAQGAHPYVIPVGGSTPLGTLGAYRCYEEIAAALPQDAWICCATGSGGTHAGLVLGAHRLGKAKRVQGFSVSKPSTYMVAITSNLIAGAAQLQGEPWSATDATPAIHVDENYYAPRYGKASPEGLAAIELVARLEGIILDHVYTGKAMAGVLDYIRKGIIPQGEQVVFVHTGGAPAIFAGIN
jgi:D-cysteine desulfhydrase family pyridoxal phosphate-dependent enzyme